MAKYKAVGFYRWIVSQNYQYLLKISLKFKVVEFFFNIIVQVKENVSLNLTIKLLYRNLFMSIVKNMHRIGT